MVIHSEFVPPVEKIDGVVAVKRPPAPEVKPERLLEPPLAV
jgi:hypothetical protein